MSDEKRDFYLEWSTVVDAPTTFGMSLDEFKDFYRQEYGNQEMQQLPQRLERVERTGSSEHGKTLDDVLIANRAGKNETEISKAEIFRKYCIERPSK